MLVGQIIATALIFDMVYLVKVQASESKERFCGKKLATIMQLLCKEGYNMYPGYTYKTDNGEEPRRRVRRGVVDECCLKTCSHRTLRMYCSVSSEEPIRSPQKRSNNNNLLEVTNGLATSDEAKSSLFLNKLFDKNPLKTEMKHSMNDMFSNENHIRHKSHGKSLHSKRDIKQDVTSLLDVAQHEENASDDLNLSNDSLDNSSTSKNKIRHPSSSNLANVLNENKKPLTSIERRTRRQPKIGSVLPYFYSKSLLVPKLRPAKPL